MKAAIETLAAGIIARSRLNVEVEAGTWPDDLRTEADHVLYGAAREALTNAVKHAGAQNLWVELELRDGQATLRIADDGVGISRRETRPKCRGRTHRDGVDPHQGAGCQGVLRREAYDAGNRSDRVASRWNRVIGAAAAQLAAR